MILSTINLNQLRVFECVFRKGSMTGAAQELHLTQSGISQHIRSLEDILEFRLFDRIHSRLVPTPKAQILFEKCKASFGEIEKTLSVLKSQHTSLTGTVNIGTPMEFGNNIILPQLSKLSQKHPGLKFNLKYGFAAELSQELLNGSLDFAFLDGLGIDKRFSIRTVYDEVIFLCASSTYLKNKHPLRETREFFQSLSYVDYQANEPFLRHWFYHHFGFKNLRLDVKATMMNAQGVARFIQDASAVGILPSHLFDKMLQNGSKLHVFQGSGRPLRNRIQLTYLKEKTLSPAADKILERLLRSMMTLEPALN